jgi:fumarate reductase (CoM/CoB) subunit B
MSQTLRLPLLSERTRELETCGYCPKLCRAACPVSNAEPRDTLTPWGKMSICWFAGRGDVPVSLDYGRVAWACTGCRNCRQNCDHRNAVADTLAAARADFFAAGAAPEAARRSAARHAERLRRIARRIEELSVAPAVDAHADRALLVGCGYLLGATEEARDAVLAAAALVGPVRLLAGCCGAPLRDAGDRPGFETAQRALADELGSSELVVVDPGCAITLGEQRPLTLVELAARHLDRLARVPDLGGAGRLRWQDPCQLGRGLGQYDAPRAVLGLALGREPDEFARSRSAATCSGAGALLPVMMPDVSRRIALERVAEHERLGGGTIVTGCGAGLRRLRSCGARVMDLSTVIRRSVDAHE